MSLGNFLRSRRDSATKGYNPAELIIPAGPGLKLKNWSSVVKYVKRESNKSIIILRSY